MGLSNRCLKPNYSKRLTYTTLNKFQVVRYQYILVFILKRDLVPFKPWYATTSGRNYG